MVILLHTSKSMRKVEKQVSTSTTPQLLSKTEQLGAYLKTLQPAQIQKFMKVSPTLATKTYELIQGFTLEPQWQRPAIDSFIGDIYSGLQVQVLSAADRAYAQHHLRILSGLYGILRPLDGVYPYRLEMGYKLPDEPYSSLYKFWGDSIARTLPNSGLIINLSAVEYSKTVSEHIDKDRVITPKFLTLNPKTKEPTFVVIHAKIARGAFARWLIQERVTNTGKIKDFSDLGYGFNQSMSTDSEPVFICKEFGGLGLSVRLT